MLHRLIDCAESAQFFVNIIEYPELLKWCLDSGFHIAKTMNMMVLGHYQAPKPGSVYLPSVGGL